MIEAIGARVWYYPSKAAIQTELIKLIDPLVPLMANICFCNGDSQTVNIVGVDHWGYWCVARDVQVFPYDAVPKDATNYCVWPPGSKIPSFYAPK